nr:protein NPG1 [Tanacetum cinerariifolium]
MPRWSKAWTRAAKVGKGRIQSTADLFIMMNKQYIDVTGGSMLRGQRPLALIVSAQQRFSKAKVVTDAAARAETVKWDDGLLLRLRAKLEYDF